MTHPAVRRFLELRTLAELAALLGIPDARELWGMDGAAVAELLDVMEALRGE